MNKKHPITRGEQLPEYMVEFHDLVGHPPQISFPYYGHVARMFRLGKGIYRIIGGQQYLPNGRNHSYLQSVVLAGWACEDGKYLRNATGGIADKSLTLRCKALLYPVPSVFVSVREYKGIPMTSLGISAWGKNPGEEFTGFGLQGTTGTVWIAFGTILNRSTTATKFVVSVEGRKW